LSGKKNAFEKNRQKKGGRDKWGHAHKQKTTFEKKEGATRKKSREDLVDDTSL